MRGRLTARDEVYVRLRTVAGVALASAVACGGTSVDDASVGKVLDAVEGVSEAEMVPRLVVVGLTEEGSRPVSAACAEPLGEGYGSVAPDQRGMVLSRALLACEQPCGKEVLKAMAMVDPTQKTELLIAGCTEAGVEDAVFDGDLAGLRPEMDVADWYFGRMLIGGIRDESPGQASRWDAVIPRFAAGSVLGTPLVDPDTTKPLAPVSKLGDADEFVKVVRADPAIAACGAGRLVIRVVADGTGKPLGVRGEGPLELRDCVTARLNALSYAPAMKGGAASFDLGFDVAPAVVTSDVPGFAAIATVEQGDFMGSSVILPGAVAALPKDAFESAGLVANAPYVVLSPTGRSDATWAGVQTHKYGCMGNPTEFAVFTGAALNSDVVWLLPAGQGADLSVVAAQGGKVEGDVRTWTVGDLPITLRKTAPTKTTLSIGAWEKPYELEVMDGVEPEVDLYVPMHVPVPELGVVRDGKVVALVFSEEGYESGGWVDLRPDGANWVEHKTFGLYRCAF